MDLLPLTLMEKADLEVLKEEYRKANGNISLTARTIGWSRTKTLKWLKEHKLWSLYRHERFPKPKKEA